MSVLWFLFQMGTDFPVSKNGLARIHNLVKGLILGRKSKIMYLKSYLSQGFIHFLMLLLIIYIHI